LSAIIVYGCQGLLHALSHDFRLRHFQCKEFYLLVLWIWNQNSAIYISTIVGTLSHNIFLFHSKIPLTWLSSNCWSRSIIALGKEEVHMYTYMYIVNLGPTVMSNTWNKTFNTIDLYQYMLFSTIFSYMKVRLWTFSQLIMIMDKSNYNAHSRKSLQNYIRKINKLVLIDRELFLIITPSVKMNDLLANSMLLFFLLHEILNSS